MPHAQLQFGHLGNVQQDWYLDLILRNRAMYDDFLAFAETKFQGESVRFLRTMVDIPWNGNTPVGADVQRGIFATYIREGSFFQVNLPRDKVRPLEQSVDAETRPDWGPAIAEIRRLITSNFLVRDYLAERERRAQGGR